MTEPIFFGTEMDYAWDAFQKAYDGGKRQPERADFDDWWERVALQTKWEDKQHLMDGAWQEGVYCRNRDNTAAFNVYWDNRPCLTMSLEKVMWTAYQAAFDAGKLLPSHAAFQEWWAVGQLVEWKELHEELQAAWSAGVQDREEQGHAGFAAWWQEILDHQPVFGKAKPE